MAAIAQMDTPVKAAPSTPVPAGKTTPMTPLPAMAPAMSAIVHPNATPAVGSAKASSAPAVNPVLNAESAPATPAHDLADGPIDPELDISLECLLCPKKPKFSDVSHLLTHIGSKAHLSQKFNAQFESGSNLAASEKLKQYEKWYADNGIERLLSERIQNKAKGKPPRSSRASGTPKHKPARKSAPASAPASTPADDFIKKDVSEPVSAYRTPDQRPPIAYWSTASNGHGGDSGYGVGRDHYANGAPYSTLGSVRQRSGSYAAYPGDNSSLLASDKKPASFADPTTAPASEAGSFFVAEDETSLMKLKGIIWPGMDMFDAATPDQKRKRNQRKDDAAIDLLKATSLAVTATEQVWGPMFELRKDRDIYASPSPTEGSPPSTPPPPRKRKSRAVTKAEDDQDERPAKKRNSRGTGSRPTAKARSNRASTQASEGADKKAQSVRETSAEIEDAVYALGRSSTRSFNVYYDPANPQASLLDQGHAPNSFDQLLHDRPALQQLDSNLSIADGDGYFKHTTTSAHYYANGRQSPHLPQFHSTQPQPYGNGYQSMTQSMAPGMPSNTLNPLNPLNTQPRSAGGSGMYPPFDGQMFGGGVSSSTTSATDPTATVPSSYNTDSRRVGVSGVPSVPPTSYSDFNMDPNASPFGYDDQRNDSLRDGSYTDPTFPGSSRMFEL